MVGSILPAEVVGEVGGGVVVLLVGGLLVVGVGDGLTRVAEVVGVGVPPGTLIVVGTAVVLVNVAVCVVAAGEVDVAVLPPLQPTNVRITIAAMMEKLIVILFID
jgi:hypothetical protein